MSDLDVRWMPLVLPLAAVLCLAVFATPARAAGGDADASAGWIVDAARNLISTLSAEQRARAVLPFDAEAREDWHYIPKLNRKGLPFKDLDAEQVHLAHVLLNASLSGRGYFKASTIMSLESLVKLIDMEAGRSEQVLRLRDPFLYYLTIFGEPGPGARWGWSIEGHHLSLNFTLVGDRVASSPTFLGAEPHHVVVGPRSGLRVLGHEEDLARALLGSLDDGQRAQAILAPRAPADIATAAARAVRPDQPPKGLAAAAMTSEQQAALRHLIEVYVENVPPDLQARRRAQYEEADFAQIHFAWMGSTEKGLGNGHYYRVQAPTFLIEYDNVQNDANHSHTVWRDYDGDFGRDLLAEHHAAVEH
ncbi:MAG TPA: DUF3500 domain-containing protein [Thermoanaerobaculia bacterium]|nr:DUF3500 domain-containing protein [Thermoanaerobaculia bacterium]